MGIPTSRWIESVGFGWKKRRHQEVGENTTIRNNAKIFGYEAVILVNGGNVLIVESDDIRAHYVGLHIAGGDVSVENNTIHDIVAATGSGIFIEGTQSVSVTNGNIIRDCHYGIRISTNSSTVIRDGNEIFDNEYGISVQGGNASIRYNNSIHHNQWGIYLNTSHGPEVSNNNTIENNSDYGTYIYNANLTYMRMEWNGIIYSASDLTLILYPCPAKSTSASPSASR
ncbi:MAG: right-handed parallel beta-helix repeat-containing protein [Thermoplasmata archaeon]